MSERRRRRPAISCALCRRRKIRCNRESPCSNCIRSRNTVCVYETEPWIKSSDQAQTQSLPQTRPPSQPQSAMLVTPTWTDMNSLNPRTLIERPTSSISSGDLGCSSFELESMRARVIELEKKLSQTTSTTASVYSPPLVAAPVPTDSVNVVNSFAGTIHVLQDSRQFGRAHSISRGTAHKNRVFGQSHWMNGFIVFQDIIDMIGPVLRSGTSSMLRNLKIAKNLARAIKASRTPTWPTLPTRDLPPKHICDQLIERYLSTIETLHRTLHVPTFRKEYQKIWLPDGEPTIDFIILLKLVLALGASTYDEKFSLRKEAMLWIYEAQTWLSSPVFKSRLGIQYLQISILLLLAREIIDVGAELVWISAGAVFRAAVYIGLHKDPVRLPSMNLFEAEMRRRIWNTLLEICLQLSLESGGPCSISMEDFNTQPPGNFDDDDLTMPDPTAKPSNVYTQSSIAIALRKTLPERVAIVRFLNDTVSPGTYQETLRLDTELRAVYKTLRLILQAFEKSAPLPLSDFVLQAVDYTTQRYMSSLHVPFFGPSLNDPAYAYSRKVVVDTATKIWMLAVPPKANTTQFDSGRSSHQIYDYSIETDLNRLCRCGAGFFRTSAFHASTFLGVNLRCRIQEDGDTCLSTLSPIHANIMQDTSNCYLQYLEAGETSIKGYILLDLISSQIESVKQNMDITQAATMMVKKAEVATEKAIALLESIVDQLQPENTPITPEEFNLQVSPDFIEDWDLIMSDAFYFGDSGTLNEFLV